MGLDLVEFVMTVEDAFRLSIPDAEATGLATPGQLVDYVEAQLGSANNSVCIEQRAFYALRRVVVDLLRVNRTTIRPDTRWHDCIPYRDHRQVWQSLQLALGVAKWPSLTWQDKLPQQLSTIGSTACYLAAYTPGDFKYAGETWSRQDIQRTIQHLMAQEFDIKTFNWTDRFVGELGLD